MPNILAEPIFSASRGKIVVFVRKFQLLVILSFILGICRFLFSLAIAIFMLSVHGHILDRLLHIYVWHLLHIYVSKVGPSGCGKSTLVNLLVLYESTNGLISNHEERLYKDGHYARLVKVLTMCLLCSLVNIRIDTSIIGIRRVCLMHPLKYQTGSSLSSLATLHSLKSDETCLLNRHLLMATRFLGQVPWSSPQSL